MATILPFRPRSRVDDPVARRFLLGALRDARRHAEVDDGRAWLISARQTIEETLAAYRWDPYTRADLHAISHRVARFERDAALAALSALEARVLREATA